MGQAPQPLHGHRRPVPPVGADDPKRLRPEAHHLAHGPGHRQSAADRYGALQDHRGLPRAEQKEAVWKALVINYRPENRKYLYNFVFDNCATRPYLLIENALGQPIRSDYTGHTGTTYRAFIRHYTGSLSWENAGINLLFGPKADQPMTDAQRLFLPEELMYYLQDAYLEDGTPLISQSLVAPFVINQTPWYASWPFGLALFFLLVATVSVYDRLRGHWSWGLELVIAIPYILLILLVTFLTFFSCHPLVGFGWRLLIIPLTHLCARLIYIIR